MAKILEKFFRNPYRYMYIFMCVASLLLIAFNNYWIFLITMISLLLICITISKLDFCHPYCNILPILVLYQIAFPILNHYGIKVFETVNIHSMYYLYSWIATNCFILFLGKITNPINYSKKDLELKTNNKILLFFYCLLSFLAIVASIYIIYKGYSSKYELSQNLNILLQVGMIAYVALIPITFYNYFNKENKNKKLKIIIIILTLILMFFGMMTTGERSYAFNYILMSFLAVTSLFKIDLKKKIAVILILVLFVANY